MEAFTVKWLLDPVSPTEFVGDYWGSRPFLLERGDKRFYRAVLDESALSKILDEQDLRYPNIQLAKDGKYVSPALYVQEIIQESGSIRDKVIKKLSVIDQFEKGATVVVNAADRLSTAINRLIASLERYFIARSSANLYWTPPDTPGFGRHYDEHDVFILQLAGTKQWEVFSPKDTDMYSTTTASFSTDHANPLCACVLQSGDLLYIPRGFPHRAAPLGHRSLHLALGLTPFTYADLFSCLTAYLQRRSNMEQRLPHKLLKQATFGMLEHADVSHISEELRGLIETEIVHTAILGLLRDRIAAIMPVDDNLFGDLLGLTEFDPNRQFFNRAHLMIIEQTGQALRLLSNGRCLEIPAKHAQSLRILVDSDIVTIAELPGDYIENKKLIQFLIREGILE